MSAAEKQELIQRDEPRQVAQHSSGTEADAWMQVIERVATSPEADVEKLERMMAMHERVQDRSAKQAFTADLATMQTDLPRIAERGEGHNKAKYALLEDINDALRPILHRHGFAVTFRIKHEEKVMWITTVLSHREGHSEETSIPLALDTSGSKNAVQAVGSTISYGKRYGICALLNISTGDDVDGAVLGQGEDDINAELAAIRGAKTMQELQAEFTQAYTANKSSRSAIKTLTEAKDTKKRELAK